MRLSILITHYDEPWSELGNLIDSIKLQRGINFSDLEVIIANDGRINFPTFEECPFTVTCIDKEHSGVSATRNFALDHASGDYVMFCDCDDMFLNNCGLHLVFGAMNSQPDAITSSFVEEIWQGDEYKILRHDKDTTFIHGKVYRRQFLIDENIRFKEELTIHEDGYFNLMANVLAESTEEITTPFYLWKWNDNSTVRKDPDAYVLKTYENLMESRIAISEELEKRGLIDNFITSVCKTVFDSYYDFNKPEYNERKNSSYRNRAERAFKKYYTRFGKEYLDAGVKRKAEIMQFCRTNAYNHGMIIEQCTIKEWLNHITKEV